MMYVYRIGIWYMYACMHMYPMISYPMTRRLVDHLTS